jgi:hypothetical protein
MEVYRRETLLRYLIQPLDTERGRILAEDLHSPDPRTRAAAEEIAFPRAHRRLHAPIEVTPRDLAASDRARRDAARRLLDQPQQMPCKPHPAQPIWRERPIVQQRCRTAALPNAARAPGTALPARSDGEAQMWSSAPCGGGFG